MEPKQKKAKFNNNMQITTYNNVMVNPTEEIIKISASKYNGTTAKSLKPVTDPDLYTFLDLFLDDSDDNITRTYKDVKYRYLKVGTRTSCIKQYNRFVIGNNLKIYRLGILGSLHSYMAFKQMLLTSIFLHLL